MGMAPGNVGDTDDDNDGVLDIDEAGGIALGKDCRVETDCDGDTILDQDEAGESLSRKGLSC